MKDTRLRNTRHYEWVAEPLDKHGDIIDPYFTETLTDLEHIPAHDDAVRVDIALVVYIGNDANGETAREYAYIVDGKLPEEFDDLCIKIPKRFHNELARFMKSGK